MKLKRLSIIFVFMLALNTFFSSFAYADGTSKQNLVALGDSITHGWNLGDDKSSNQPINEKAFPYLIGNGKYTVSKNISGGGWTTTDLLNAMSSAENMEAIKNANIITLDIGSNDLLKVPEVDQILKQLKANPPVAPTQQQVAAATGALMKIIKDDLPQKMGAVITSIKSINPDAPIIFYNLYNPFGVNTGILHDLGVQIIPVVNSKIIEPAASASGSIVADAYSAIEGHQSDYILPGDIHPNETGHQVLAGLANDILPSLGFDLTLTPSTTEVSPGSVTVTVSTTAKEVVEMKWLEGEKSAADFEGAGTVIKDNKFEVTKNGKYTVYAKDSYDHVNVQVIEIANIAPPAPKDFTINLTPSTTDSTTAPVSIKVSTTAEKVAEMKWLKGEKTVADFANAGTAITDNQFDVTENSKYTVYVKDWNGLEQVQMIDISNITTGDSSTGGTDHPGDNGTPTDQDSKNTLPETASTMYNYAAVGLGIILIGLSGMAMQQLRRRREDI